MTQLRIACTDARARSRRAAGCWLLVPWRATTTRVNVPAYWLRPRLECENGHVEQNGAGPARPDQCFPRGRQPDRARRCPRPHQRPQGPDRGRRRRRLRRAGQRGRGHPAAGARHRHPDAADVPARGHRRRPRGAQAPPGDRGRGALPVRRPRVRGLAAGRGLGRLRLPAQGPRRRGQPAGRRDPGGGDRRHRPRPVDRRGAGRPGGPGRRPAARRGRTARHGRRGQDDQGDRRGAPGPARGGRRGGRRGLRQAGPGRVRGKRRRAAAAPPAAPGHRRPGGAGRDAVPAAAERPGRQAAAGAAGHRRDRTGRGDGPHERHPLATRPSPSTPTRASSPASSTRTGRR